MPGRNKLAGKGAFGAVGTVRSFMGVVKEIDFDEVRDRAEHPPRVVLVGPTKEEAVEAATSLFGDRPERYVDCRAESDAASIAKDHVDIVIACAPASSGMSDRLRVGDRVPLVRLDAPRNDLALDRTRYEIVSALPDLAPAFGRFFPPFKTVAVKGIIDDTARANAQFALVSNIPAIVPVLGSFVAASADLLVLTKNQVMMAYKLAAIHNRDLHDQAGVLRELAPVVGAGFLWRSIAREATSFIPFAAGTVPKVAIAYAGTYSTGKAIDYYYRFGKKPDAAQIRLFAKQAGERVAQLPGQLRKGTSDRDSAIEAQSTRPLDDVNDTRKLQ